MALLPFPSTYKTVKMTDKEIRPAERISHEIAEKTIAAYAVNEDVERDYGILYPSMGICWAIHTREKRRFVIWAAVIRSIDRGINPRRFTPFLSVTS